MEGFKPANPEKGDNYPSEGRLLMDDLLESMGLTRQELHKLPASKKQKAMAEIKEIYQSPEVQSILLNREHSGLNAEDALMIRESVGVDKWNKLSEVVSYVKTLLGDKTVEERKEIFAKHLAFGVDVNEIQHTLTRINDVMPARIDTDIKHQSSLFYRAVVEVASNALDASVKHRSPIGRFGVGFYQILNHLNDPKDKVIVRTKSADSSIGSRVEFRNRNGEIVLKVSEDSSISEHGTTVELFSKEFEASKAEGIIKEYFSHNQDAELVINGKQLDRWKPDGGAKSADDIPSIDIKIEDGKCIVSDNGIGMPPRVIFEKLLVPKLSEKPPIYELREKGSVAPRIYYERGNSDNEQSGEIVIQVGGIVIERERCRGVSMAKTLVIDLPPSTVLGEQRNEVEVDRNTIEAMRQAVDQAVQLPRPECFEAVNSLGVACRKLQDRSKLYGPGDNVFVYLQEKVKETFPDLSFLPNKKEFLELDLDQDKTVLLDPSIYQSALRSTNGLTEVSTWLSKGGTALFKAKFKEGSKLGVIVNDNLIVIDERIDVNKNPEIVSKAMELTVGYGKGQVVTGMETGSELEKERKNFDSLRELVSEQWESFYFKSKEIALREAKIYERKNPEICSFFAQRIFGQLQKVGAMEAWSILDWYINTDSRDLETQLKEVNQLASNISVFFSNPKVSEVLQTNKVPLLSMFETFAPDISHHIRTRIGNPEGKEVIINGEKYYFVKANGNAYSGWPSSSIDFYTEDGKSIRLFGWDSLYIDENITVLKDKIIDTKTREDIESRLPIETPLGTITLNNESGRGNRESRFTLIGSDVYKQVQSGHGLERTAGGIWDIRPDKTGSQFIYYNGGKEINLSDVIEKAQIPKDCQLSSVFKTEKGEIRLTFSNSHISGGGYFLNNEYGRDNVESFFIVDQNGNVLWKLNEVEWGDKIYPDEDGLEKIKARQGHDYIHMLGETRIRASRCVPIQYEGLLSDNDPVVKIIRYDFNGHHRIREVVGYITTSGEVVDTASTDKVNSTVLDARYAWEGGCCCCDVNTPFNKGSYSPFEEDKDGKVLLYSGNFIKLPVTIVGEFQFDEVNHEWIALSNSKEGYSMAIFDEKGVFLRDEEIGCNPEIVRGRYDFRDLREYLLSRFPDRLKSGINTEDTNDSYNSYKSQIKGLFSFKKGLVLNQKTIQGYSYEYVPELREVDNLTRGFLDSKKGELTAEHMKVLEKHLLKFPIPDREKLERLTYRIIELRYLPPNDIEFLLPVLYETETIAPGFFTSNMMDLLRSVSHLDAERFSQLFNLMYNSLPDNEEEKEKTASKIIKFYKEKLQGESLSDGQKIVEELSQVKGYSNAIICDGYTLIKYNVSVPQAEISREIRPFLTFVRSEEDELAYKETEGLKTPEVLPQTIRLSEIIQWKRLRESEAKDFTEINTLGEKVHKITHGKTREHIIREITHAVHFQALNSTDLYVRELIQNAVDVMQGESMDKKDRNIEITTSATDNHELITHFHDPVGMDVRTVINYFLVPGESTKTDRSKNFIGFYGQGVYTLFKSFKEISVKTSVGDGTVCYLMMKPVVEHDMVADVSIDFRFVDEDFKGTIISKVQKAENPYVEAAYVKDAVMTLTSALSDDRASIIYQKEKVNSEYKVLSKGQVGNLGELTVYRNPNNIISQYGLYVKDMDSEYLGLIPGFMSRSLQRWGGIAIDLPKGVELTRSRQEIANKDKISDILNPQIQLKLVAGYLKSFKEKMDSGEASFPFESLPYDYFFEAEHYGVPVKYKEDVEALVNGKSLKYIDEYVEESNTLKLMALLPLFDVGDKKVCLDEIRIAFSTKEKTAPYDKEGWMNSLPGKLVELLEKQREQRDCEQIQREEAKKNSIPDGTLEQVFEKSPEELKKWITENKEKLESLGLLTQTFIDTVDEAFLGLKRTTGMFHYSETGELAHARRGGDMSWNLANMKSGYNPLEAVKKFEERDKGIKDLLSPIFTVAHEYGHIVEGFMDWTHDPQHDREQARVLLQFLIQNGPEKLLESLKQNAEKKILQKINTTLSSLSIKDEWIKAPEFLPEYHFFKDKKVLMVDDVMGVIANNLPEYITATAGKANAIYHTRQSLDELVSQIIGENPDIVLMDYSLANEITGASVIKELQAKGFKGKIVGHSSESRSNEFKEAGAVGSIDKGSGDVSKSVKELIKLARGY